jgi:hypothetical protein
VPINEYNKVAVNPMFVSCCDKWKHLGRVLLNKKLKEDENFVMIAPDMFWEYSLNTALLSVIKEEGVYKISPHPITGNVLIKATDTFLRSVVPDYEKVFVKESDEE